MANPAKKRLTQPCPTQFVADFLNFYRSLVESPSPEDVIDRAVAFYETFSPLPKGSQLTEGFFTTVALEKEGGSVPISSILEALKLGADNPYRTRLLLASQAYCDSARYLLPFIYGFAKATMKLSGERDSQKPPILFLRDSLIFWPVFLSAEESVHFILYSRLHAELGELPRLYKETGPSSPVTEIPLRQMPANPLLIDVGLYGTLVGRLLDSGMNKKSVGAFFFASRSPFIAGWLNDRFTSSKYGFDSTDIVRLADTMESLLKPFQVIEAGGTLHIVPSDIVSFCSSVLLLWALYQYRTVALPCSDGEMFRNLESAKRGNSWFVKHPVPKWSGADRFLRSWRHGALYPVGNTEGTTP